MKNEGIQKEILSMTGFQIAVFVLIAAAIIISLLFKWHKESVLKRASILASKVFPVWAEQGPFDSGEQSAAAMRYAFLASFGKEEAEKMGMMKTISSHAHAFDSNPVAWELNRQKAKQLASTETEKLVAIAKGLAAIDSINKDLLESSENKLEIENKSDGNMEIVLKKVYTDIIHGLDTLNVEDQTRKETNDVELHWSANPSAYEAHLMRRHNNPYFPESRRSVSREDLQEAKRKDKDDFILCQQRLEAICKEIEALQAGNSDDLMALRNSLDDLIFFSLGVGGPATEIVSKADRLRDALISDLRSALVDNDEALSKIEKANDYHNNSVRKFYIPVIAQMSRENSPILKEETIPTILSENPIVIAKFVNSLSQDGKALTEVAGLKILQEGLNSGHIDPQLEEKIYALGGHEET